MRGRTMYVIPYLMGPVGLPHSRVGLQVRDSLCITASVHIMMCVGSAVLDHLSLNGDFVAGLHSLGGLSP
jgi:phosphoenolpyruvate carboxykinase (GTP)